MSELTIRRSGWAGYVVTTEWGTKIVVEPYLHASEGVHKRGSLQPVWKGWEPSLFLPR